MLLNSQIWSIVFPGDSVFPADSVLKVIASIKVIGFRYSVAQPMTDRRHDSVKNAGNSYCLKPKCLANHKGSELGF